MEKWRKERNYSKFIDADGTVRHVITIDGKDVNVTAEVYRAYAQADRRERYAYEREKGLLLSLEQMDEDNVQFAYLSDKHSPSAEDIVIRQMLVSEALDVLSTLAPHERLLIESVVMDGVSERKYAARIGVTQKSVNKCKQKILKKIRRILVLKTPNFRDG